MVERYLINNSYLTARSQSFMNPNECEGGGRHVR